MSGHVGHGRLIRTVALEDDALEALAERLGARASTPPDLASQPLVDAEHVAELLAVQRRRVYELARRSQDPLPALRIGGALRFALADVEAWVARQRA